MIFTPYRNPIIPVMECYACNSDPYVIYEDGWYYRCFACENGVKLSRAKELWNVGKGEEKLIYDSTKHDAFDTWFAPEVHKIGDRWVVLGAPDNKKGAHAMAALVSDDIFGEYTFGGFLKGLPENNEIDATVFTHNDRLYISFAGYDAKGSKLLLADFNEDLEVSNSVVISRPEFDWEKQSYGGINEGPAVLKKGPYIHIVYSANDSRLDDYCLGLLTYKSGDILDPANWKKTGPVFSKTEDVFGPGHCSFTKVGDTDYIVYHANEVSGSSWAGRSTWIQPFTWENDFPVFGKPRRK